MNMALWRTYAVQKQVFTPLTSKILQAEYCASAHEVNARSRIGHKNVVGSDEGIES
jgi:hypothetical protein